MTLIAVSGVGLVIPLLFVLVCPLMMVVMMRGMHSRGGEHGHDESKPREQMTLDELKEARDELNAEIGDRAAASEYPRRV